MDKVKIASTADAVAVVVQALDEGCSHPALGESIEFLVNRGAAPVAVSWLEEELRACFLLADAEQLPGCAAHMRAEAAGIRKESSRWLRSWLGLPKGKPFESLVEVTWLCIQHGITGRRALFIFHAMRVEEVHTHYRLRGVEACAEDDAHLFDHLSELVGALAESVASLYDVQGGQSANPSLVGLPERV